MECIPRRFERPIARIPIGNLDEGDCDDADNEDLGEW